MAQRTDLAFQRDGHLSTLKAKILSVKIISSLPQEDRDLFKAAQPDSYAVITDVTVFHPQGGGQPSDEGIMTLSSSPPSSFLVQMVRTSATNPQQVLHFGQFPSGSEPFPDPSSSSSSSDQSAAVEVTQTLDPEKRLLYSRYHTAGHVLGSAVRTLLENEIPGFDETKASHFPDSAACEFSGSIEGKWKDAIQAKLDEYVERDMPVEIEWWDEGDFERNGLTRLTPDRRAMGLAEGERFRVVRIVGAETYPCGGTHVDSTRLCGRTTVKKIGRSKGTSRVGYHL